MKWRPTPVFLPGKSHGWRSPAGYSKWGHKESDTTEQLTLSLSFSCSSPKLWCHSWWHCHFSCSNFSANYISLTSKIHPEYDHFSLYILQSFLSRVPQFLTWIIVIPFCQVSHLQKSNTERENSILECFIKSCIIRDYAKAFDCVDHNKLWKILKGMGMPYHLTCLLRNLYAGQVVWYFHLFQNFPVCCDPQNQRIWHS